MNTMVHINYTERVNNLRIFETDKLVVLTKQKVASRFLESGNWNEMYSGINVTWEGDIVATNHNDIVDSNNNILNQYDVFLKEKNNKNIILLYRNPYERFLSGLIQTTILSYLDNPMVLMMLPDVVSEYKLFKNRINLLVFGCKSIISITNIPNDSEYDSNILYDESIKLLNILTAGVIKTIVEFNIPHEIHFDNYLMVYNSLINYKFDSNKVTLVNIDDSRNELSNVLKNYITIDKHESHHSNTVLKEILKHHISDNKIILERIKDYIRIDSYFYNQFEKSKLNILNKPVI